MRLRRGDRGLLAVLVAAGALAIAPAGVAVLVDSATPAAPARSDADAGSERSSIDATTAPPRPGLGPPGGEGPEPDVRDEAAARFVEAGSRDPGPHEDVEPARVTTEGFEVAPGGSAAGTGPEVTYTVEVEPKVGADLLAVTATVEASLTDPRSWVRDHRLVRVDDPEAAAIRVVLATPDTVDALCLEAGLDTRGEYSCWNGEVAALNGWRWDTGAEDVDDLTTYRRYLVNHEVGHGLGHGHLDCPEPGEPAPVMMQQTMGTEACVANAWPYPDAPLEPAPDGTEGD